MGTLYYFTLIYASSFITIFILDNIKYNYLIILLYSILNIQLYTTEFHTVYILLWFYITNLLMTFLNWKAYQCYYSIQNYAFFISLQYFSGFSTDWVNFREILIYVVISIWDIIVLMLFLCLNFFYMVSRFLKFLLFNILSLLEDIFFLQNIPCFLRN